MPITVQTNLDFLIDELRLELGDTDNSSYRYTDDWLRTSLISATKTLMTWWNYKYLINDTTFDVERNPSHAYIFASPPILEKGDERPIVLMAFMTIGQGALQESSWNLGSWKDAEISYSNIQGGRSKDRGMERAWNELMGLIKPPTSRLAQPTKGSLPGFKNNQYEYD